MCLAIFYIKNELFRLQKVDFWMVAKLEFFKGDSPILVKNWTDWTFFFSDKVFNGNVFGYVSYDKQAILDYNIGDFW